MIEQSTLEELFKIIHQWSKTENYPVENTEKIISSLRLLIRDKF